MGTPQLNGHSTPSSPETDGTTISELSSSVSPESEKEFCLGARPKFKKKRPPPPPPALKPAYIVPVSIFDNILTQPSSIIASYTYISRIQRLLDVFLYNFYLNLKLIYCLLFTMYIYYNKFKKIFKHGLEKISPPPLTLKQNIQKTL